MNRPNRPSHLFKATLDKLAFEIRHFGPGDFRFCACIDGLEENVGDLLGTQRISIAVYRSKSYPTRKRADGALNIFRANMHDLFELAERESL